MPNEQRIIFDDENRFPWTSTETTFDTDTNLVIARRTVFDDDTERQETFDQGIRISAVQTDNIDEFGNRDVGVKTREPIETLYDTDGRVE